jgi:hypothetical protein
MTLVIWALPSRVVEFRMGKNAMNPKRVSRLLLATLGIALFVSCTHKPAVELPFRAGAVTLQMQPPTTFQGLRLSQSWTEANAALKAHGFDELSPIDYSGAPDSNQDGSSHAAFHHLMVLGSCSGDFCDGYEPELAEGTIFVFFNHSGKLHGGVVVQAYSEAYLKHEAEEKAEAKAQPIEKPKCFTIGGVFQITAGMSREEIDGHFKNTSFPPLSCTKELNQRGEVMLDCVTGGMTDDGMVGWEFMIENGISKLSIERFPASKYPVLYKAAAKTFGNPTTTANKMATWFNPFEASCSDSLQLALNGREADMIVTDLRK